MFYEIDILFSDCTEKFEPYNPDAPIDVHVVGEHTTECSETSGRNELEKEIYVQHKNDQHKNDYAILILNTFSSPSQLSLPSQILQ